MGTHADETAPLAGLTTRVKRWLLNGVIISIPLVVTILVIMLVLEFLLRILSPLVGAVEFFWANEPPVWVLELATLVSLLAFFLLVGVLAECTPGQRVSQWFDRSMASIPVISTIYTTVRRTSEIFVSDESSQFQDVKLVEFPHQDAYMLGFVTTDAPTPIEESLLVNDMLTLMIPLAPNPATNGFIIYMPDDRVHEVDMDVEQAIQAVTTLGVMTDGLENGATARQ